MPYASLTLFNGCPIFFQSFNTALVSTDRGRALAHENGLILKQTGMGLHYLDGVQGAASKWRLAQSATGLEYSAGTDVSDDLKLSYSAQVRVVMAVIAFEAFSRMFRSNDWPSVSSIVLSATNDSLCVETRRLLDSAGTLEHLYAVSNSQQQKRLLAFEAGDDSMLYAVCVALRNAFAHGAIGGKAELLKLSPKLQGYILEGIKSYCLQKVQEVSAS